MKIRVYDSDGEYRGGLFKTDVYTAMNCRIWHAPPHPHYREHLIDIAGLGKPCREGSWFLLRVSCTPDLSGPADGSDSFDDESQAIKITAGEAMGWFRRVGFEPPSDLVQLVQPDRLPSAVAFTAPGSPSTDPFAPYMPASWFRDKYGIPLERLRSAHRKGAIRAFKAHGRWRYSVPGAKDAWPADEIRMPERQV